MPYDNEGGGWSDAATSQRPELIEAGMWQGTNLLKKKYNPLYLDFRFLTRTMKE